MNTDPAPPEEAPLGVHQGLPYTPNQALNCCANLSGRAELKGIDQGLTTSPTA